MVYCSNLEWPACMGTLPLAVYTTNLLVPVFSRALSLGKERQKQGGHLAVRRGHLARVGGEHLAGVGREEGCGQ